ncbi:MAG: hypothetical protein WD876_03800 [Candidatus Pacearchaeota archaeon]
MAENSRRIIIVLAVFVVLLAFVVLYAFVLAPAIQGYSVQRQTEGVQIAVNTILAQIQQQGYVVISVGEGQSLVLIPYVPPQEQVQQPQQ